VFDFSSGTIIEAFTIGVASLELSLHPRQVFQQFVKLVMSYSYGETVGSTALLPKHGGVSMIGIF
jgi:hypothetical protein